MLVLVLVSHLDLPVLLSVRWLVGWLAGCVRACGHRGQVEHRNRLVLGDVVLAFGELSLAGASDEAISQWIDDHSSEPNMPDSMRAGETDSDDDDDDDPFGDGGLMTVLVMRSVVVHVVALQARLAVAEHNLRQLLTQGPLPVCAPPLPLSTLSPVYFFMCARVLNTLPSLIKSAVRRCCCRVRVCRQTLWRPGTRTSGARSRTQVPP